MLIRCSPFDSALARLAQGSQLLTRSPVDLAPALFRLSLWSDGAAHRCELQRCDTHQADTRRVLLKVLARTI